MVIICAYKPVTKLYLVEFMNAMTFVTLDIANHVVFTRESLSCVHAESLKLIHQLSAVNSNRHVTVHARKSRTVDISAQLNVTLETALRALNLFKRLVFVANKLLKRCSAILEIQIVVNRADSL